MDCASCGIYLARHGYNTCCQLCATSKGVNHDAGSHNSSCCQRCGEFQVAVDKVQKIKYGSCCSACYNQPIGALPRNHDAACTRKPCFGMHQHAQHAQQTQYNGKNVIFFYVKGQPYYEFTNFYDMPITINNITYPTSEHYFQSQKFVVAPAKG